MKKWIFHQWYTKISEHVIFNSTFTRWGGGCIIWCWVIIKYKYSNLRTISCVIEQVYVHKKLTPICSKLIFRRLLIKLVTECTFKFNSRFLNQVDSCTMGRKLSVTFSDIYMVKMETDFEDDIYSRRKLRDNVLLDRLKSYHWNIKLTIKVNRSKFLDTKLTNSNGTYKFNVYQKNAKLPSPWTFNLKHATNETQSMVIFIVCKEYIKLRRRNPSDKRKVYEGWSPIAFDWQCR